MSDAHELGAPPEQGLVVRAEDEGFYVRLQPSPKVPVGVVASVVAVFGGLGFVIAQVTSSVVTVQVWVVAASVVFGGLLWALSFGQGFVPVELVGDARNLAWAGDRYAWSLLRGAEATDGSLRLISTEGRTLAELHHLDPEAAAWVAKLITASAEG